MTEILVHSHTESSPPRTEPQTHCTLPMQNSVDCSYRTRHYPQQTRGKKIWDTRVRVLIDEATAVTRPARIVTQGCAKQYLPKTKRPDCHRGIGLDLCAKYSVRSRKSCTKRFELRLATVLDKQNQSSCKGGTLYLKKGAFRATKIHRPGCGQGQLQPWWLNQVLLAVSSSHDALKPFGTHAMVPFSRTTLTSCART